MSRKFSLILVHLFLVCSTFAAKYDGNCTLSPALVAEIQSYQPIVDRIAAAAVNGSFSGNTWNRYVAKEFKTGIINFVSNELTILVWPS